MMNCIYLAQKSRLKVYLHNQRGVVLPPDLKMARAQKNYAKMQCCCTCGKYERNLKRIATHVVNDTFKN